jgi:hypothetical protein
MATDTPLSTDIFIDRLRKHHEFNKAVKKALVEHNVETVQDLPSDVVAALEGQALTEFGIAGVNLLEWDIPDQTVAQAYIQLKGVQDGGRAIVVGVKLQLTDLYTYAEVDEILNLPKGYRVVREELVDTQS